MDENLAREFSKFLISKSEIKEFIEDLNEIIDHFEVDAPVTILRRPSKSNSSLGIEFKTSAKRYNTRSREIDLSDLESENMTPMIGELKKIMVGCETIQGAKIETSVHINIDGKLVTPDEIKNWVISLNQMVKRIESLGCRISHCGNSIEQYINSPESGFDITGNIEWIINNTDEDSPIASSRVRNLINYTKILWLKKDLPDPKVLIFSEDPTSEVPNNIIDDFATFVKKWKISNDGKKELVNIISKVILENPNA